MQIQLKQSEIVDALKQYISKQGFNLAGKSVGVAFTAGRGTSGLSADIEIDELPEIPGLDECDEANGILRPTLSVVPTAAPSGEEKLAAVAAEQPKAEQTKPAEAAPATPAAAAKATSLFS